MIKQELIKRFTVAPGSKVDLKKFTTDWAGTEEAKKLGSGDKVKQRALKILEKNREELAQVQELIYANNTRSVLLIFQAMDAAGKDGTIRHVMSGVNPQGCQVYSFKKPSAEELDHNFLWRYMKSLPGARPHRHLQPQLLRRRLGGEGASRVAGPETDKGNIGQRFLAQSLRGYQ